MSGKPFDASLKDMVETHSADWAPLLGARRLKSVRVIDADVSTVSAAADKALLVQDDAGEYVLHPELQSSYDAGLPERVWWYNSVYHHRLTLAVASTAVLLRPEADGPAMTGKYQVRVPGRPGPYLVFEYNVLRLWQVPVNELLTGGVGILPVAPLADDAAGQLPDVLRAIDRRLTAEATPDEAIKLRAATSVLLSLRHTPAEIGQLLKGMWPMWEQVLDDSSIIKEYVKRGIKIGEDRGIKIGEDRGIKIGEDRTTGRFREALLKLGQKKFGAPDTATRAAIEGIADSERLALLHERILEVENWRQLLEGPPAE
jgi:predicted transposase YdaD